MTSTAVAPKIVGKALYLELVGDSTIPEDELRSLLGWQHNGTRQLIIFPEYQDDSGKVYSAVIMERLVSSYSPKAQWEFIHSDRNRVKADQPAESKDSDYSYLATYSRDEWAEATEREKFDSRKKSLEVTLRNLTISTMSRYDENGERVTSARQGWVVRDNKPIAVEITDQDMIDLHFHSKTPQAVIRRINKVRETLDKFPAKLA